jgi:nucleotide-binding universal stress UspA family protein
MCLLLGSHPMPQPARASGFHNAISKSAQSGFLRRPSCYGGIACHRQLAHANASSPNEPTEDSVFQKILVAYDGSGPARKAYDTALDLAKKYISEIHVVAVARPPEFAEEVETEAAVESAREHFQKQFGHLTSKATHVGLNPHFHIQTGHPSEQIVRVAEKHGIDLIILGHRGHGVFERWLLGSVSRTVIAYAHCAVMVVR